MTRLHLPHPHIGQLVHGVLERIHHREPMRKVPAAKDWNEWHYADAKPDWEDQNEGETR